MSSPSTIARGVALRAELVEEVDELALLLRDDGRDDLVAGALGQLHELVGDLLHRLALDDLAALGTVRHADARPQQTHVVVDLGDRADGRARVAVRRLLVDRHRGAQALDEVDVGAVDLAEELARVRAQRLDVAALALGEDRVERETRLARPGQAREHDERVARDVEVDVLEIVDAGTANTELSADGVPGRRRQGRWAPDKSRRGLRHGLRSPRLHWRDTRPAARRVPSTPDSSTPAPCRVPAYDAAAGARPVPSAGSVSRARRRGPAASVARGDRPSAVEIVTSPVGHCPSPRRPSCTVAGASARGACSDADGRPWRLLEHRDRHRDSCPSAS